MHFSDGTVEGSVATFSCDEGFIFVGASASTCLREGWSVDTTEVACELPSTEGSFR